MIKEGNSLNRNKKIAVEQCKSIDIRKLQQAHALDKKGQLLEWHWSNSEGEKVASIGITPEDNYLLFTYLMDGEPAKFPVYYTETKTGFGMRKWFACPKCGGRCAILYLRERSFACRKCQDLDYKGNQLSGSIEYHHNQLMKICKILKADYDPISFHAPPKPKGMNWKTYWKHAERYERIAAKRYKQFILEAKRIIGMPK